MLEKARLVSGFLKYKYLKRGPFYASYNVTFRCNSRCTYCDYWKSEPPELGTADALKIVDRIAESGVPMMDFSGGEPLLRNDMVELSKRAKEDGMLATMNTSGLIRKEAVIKELSRYLDTVTISLDGLPDVHDEQRGIKGAFVRSFGTMKLYKAAGLRVGINLVITKRNADTLQEFFDYIADSVDFITVQPVNPSVRFKFSDEAMGALISMKDKGKLPLDYKYIMGIRDYFDGNFTKVCEATKLYFAVDPMGQLTACPPRHDIKLGSLLEKGFWELLDEHGAEAMKEIDRCSGCYLACTVGWSYQMDSPLITSAYNGARTYLSH
ncbi:MAG: radical SAM protein [Nitrososphaerota archaeon]|nr:radical SAM protein [Nitrososphaerota archaeon]